ncbi:hypothetical protein [Ligilactobacillus pobuzihii]|uniref:hypothetical protein n=1 Tax=Ligilactobacillus pobuzihii TaxID=449659 RepID=UPI000377087F|nr:hypothetical protein [Ligilactobacillus pobuzihii]GEN48542.1 hypothetical protein LPO01_13340 [Ligilactobacillus pobuzihii]
MYIFWQTLSSWENNKALSDIQNLISLSDLYRHFLGELIKEGHRIAKKIKIKDNLAEITMYLGCVVVPVSIAFLSGSLSILVSSAGMLCILFNKEIAKRLEKIFIK